MWVVKRRPGGADGCADGMLVAAGNLTYLCAIGRIDNGDNAIAAPNPFAIYVML
ncbi:hypothetical protein GCM10027567_00600 [Spongiibacter taiwanensis]